MQAFHFHGDPVHDIGHNLLILVVMVQQVGFDTTLAMIGAAWRRYA